MSSLLRRFKRYPLRVSLTLLQVVLSSLVVTLILSIYLTPEETLEQDTFNLVAGSQEQMSLTNVFAPADVEQLSALAPAVETIGLFESAHEPVLIYNGEKYQFSGGATVTPNYFDMQAIDIVAGNAFGNAEAEAEEAVVLIEADAARIMFGTDDPIGKTVFKVITESANPPTPYRVIGTFTSLEGESTSIMRTIYFPTWAPGNLFISRGKFTASSLLVRAKPGRGEEAKAQLLAAVRQVYKDNYLMETEPVGQDYYISSGTDAFLLPDFFNPNLLILSLFGIMALVIGTIGVFSNTLVDVAERTHAIGLKRALGATRGQIGKEFALEAALLTLGSAVLGALLAALLMPVVVGPIQEQLFLFGTIRWQPLAALVAVATLVGLGAGLAVLPAYQAGRRTPISNLREA